MPRDGLMELRLGHLAAPMLVIVAEEGRQQHAPRLDIVRDASQDCLNETHVVVCSLCAHRGFEQPLLDGHLPIRRSLRRVPHNHASVDILQEACDVDVPWNAGMLILFAEDVHLLGRQIHLRGDNGRQEAVLGDSAGAEGIVVTKELREPNAALDDRLHEPRQDNIKAVIVGSSK